jgi:tRNA(Ile)-lysidine synthase
MAFSHHELVTDSGGLKTYFQASAWLIAVSGGLDSMCLLHALVLLQKNHHCPPIRILHINHNLQPQADQWQQDVEKKCQGYGLACISHKVTLCPQEIRLLGIEAAARNARYDVFKQHVQVDEVLLLGQHADDQTETLFLRLLRGAGVSGLRAMPQQRVLGLGRLVRPLLHVRQTDLYDYAKLHHLTWCEDPSNQNSHFDRNFLRHKVMPQLRLRWPMLDQRVATVTALMGDTQSLLDEVASADFMLILKEAAVGECLPCAEIKALSRPRRHNLLRYWLGRNHVPMPDYATMLGIDRDFLYSALDGQPYLRLAGGWSLRRNQGDLLLMRQAEQSSATTLSGAYTIGPQTVLDGSMALPGGVLCINQGAKGGLALVEGDFLEWRFRTGGERCKPMGRAHSQSLKKLLQEAKVPAWERDRLPLFYVNGQLAMVADLWVNSGFEADAGAPAWCWQRAS